MMLVGHKERALTAQVLSVNYASKCRRTYGASEEQEISLFTMCQKLRTENILAGFLA
jgi:hypothetical protein